MPYLVGPCFAISSNTIDLSLFFCSNQINSFSFILETHTTLEGHGITDNDVELPVAFIVDVSKHRKYK